MNRSVKDIIEEINLIVNCYWKFDTELISNHYGIFTTPIEDLDTILFKKIGINNNIEKQNEILDKIKENNYGKVNVINVQGIGKFIQIILYKKYQNLIGDYQNFEKFKIDNINKIKIIYQYLEEKVPEEFVAYKLYEEK